LLGQIKDSRPVTPAETLISLPPTPVPPIELVKEGVVVPTKYFVLACTLEKYTPRIMPVVFLSFICIYGPCLLFMSEYYDLRHGDDMYYSVE